jgi:hypothetical protein
MTQSGEGWVNWGTTVGTIAGCAVVIGGLVVIHYFKRRRRERRRERPPQSEKILRPAGYFLQQQLSDLWDQLMYVVVQTFAAGVVTGITVVTFYPLIAALAKGGFSLAQILASPKSYVVYCAALVGIGGTLWTVRGFLLVSKYYEDMRKRRFGLRGEQAVAEKLMDPELAAAGYVAFHDMPCEKGKVKWNVDHVVVGPGGVFVLETKARWKRDGTGKADANKALFDGLSLTLGGWTDREVVEQVQRNAEWVRGLIREYAPEGILVQPVIVVPGWYVESLGNYPVKAMNAKYLVGYLAGSKPVHEAKELRGVVKKLDELCRDLEF